MAVVCVNIDGCFSFLPEPAISPGEVEIRKSFGNTTSVSREFHFHNHQRVLRTVLCYLYFTSWTGFAKVTKQDFIMIDRANDSNQSNVSIQYFIYSTTPL